MKKKTPEKFSFLEKVSGGIYGILVFSSWILLIVALVVLVCYFSSFIIRREFFDKDFIQLCIYFVIGTFLIIFVYDEHCKRKFRKS